MPLREVATEWNELYERKWVIALPAGELVEIYGGNDQA